MKIKSSCFVRAVLRPEDEPRTPGPHIVFLGRSNVGKSSLINQLLGTKNLARTSSQPGRTQSINYYRVNESINFVDLPGYGYARVPESVRRSWGPMVEGFLERRRGRIALALLVVDARHEASELDLTMREWLEDRKIPYAVAATKSDKLPASRRSKAERAIREVFGGAAGCVAPLLVSVRTGLGIKSLWRHLDTAIETRSV